MTDLAHRLTATASGRAWRTAVLVAAATSTAVLAACSHAAHGPATPTGSSTSTMAAPAPHPSSTAAPVPPASDEDQAKAAVTAFEEAYNGQNWDSYRDLMCAAMRAQFTSAVMDSVKSGRADNGPSAIESITISISGDTATATILAASGGRPPASIALPLKQENGWKVCKV